MRGTTTTEGERRKLDAHATLEARRELYVNRGRRVLLAALLRRGVATADDVREGVELPAGVNPVCLGSVPGHLARAGIIRRRDFVNTTRTAGHARPVTRWELINRDAAEQWLAAHPDWPDPHTTEADDEAEETGSLFDSLTTNKKADVGASAQLRKDSHNAI